MDFVCHALVDVRRHGASHGAEQRAGWDEDFGGGEGSALSVTRRAGFVGGEPWFGLEAELGYGAFGSGGFAFGGHRSLVSLDSYCEGAYDFVC